MEDDSISGAAANMGSAICEKPMESDVTLFSTAAPV